MNGSKFYRIKRARKPLHRALLAIDIENNPFNGKFNNAALYGYIKDHHGKEHHIDKFFTSQKELQTYLDGLTSVSDKNIPCTLVFFNASYDYWFLSEIADDAKMLSSGTRIITGKLKNGIPMVDLTNFVDGTLEDWIKHLNMEEKFGIKKESLDNLEKRVKSDARATYELGHFIENFYVYELNIPLKYTVASSARYLFAKEFFKDFWVRETSLSWMNDYERAGYRGGRVEVYKRGYLHVVSYDLNSDYLNVMEKELLPDPNSAKWHSNGYDFDISMKELFIADVTVEVPEQYLPPLPYKKDVSPTSKLIFPVGTFRGKYYSPELVNAVINCGVKIIKVHSYITYTGKPYFNQFAAFIWEKRQKYKDLGNAGMEKLIKKVGNALYGSFGQRNADFNFYGKLEDYDGELEVGDMPEVSKINGIDYISVGCSTKKDSKHTFPCIPGFITSYARLDLFNGLKQNEENIVYGDTDSIKVEINEINDSVNGIVVGKELGDWGFEYEKWQWFFKAKLYADKIKGVPGRAELVYETETERTYAYRKPNKMKESIKRDLMPNKWDWVVKVVNLIDDKRIWSKDGMESRPIRLVGGAQIEIELPENRMDLDKIGGKKENGNLYGTNE